MFEITRLTVEHLAAGCVTDCSTPRIGFSLSSDRRREPDRTMTVW